MLDRPTGSQGGVAEVNAAVTVVSLEIRVASAGVSLGLRAADAGSATVLHWFHFGYFGFAELLILSISSVSPGRSAALGVARRVVPGSDTAVVRFMLGRAEAARSATVPLSEPLKSEGTLKAQPNCTTTCDDMSVAMTCHDFCKVILVGHCDRLLQGPALWLEME
jgi:hypothetical protein